MEPIPPTENPAGSSRPRRPTRRSILVAEGEADILRLNSEVLTYAGYQVDSVRDGAAAWDRLQMNRYDLVLTAQHLPAVSGVELLRKMHDTSLRLPVIMATRSLPTWEFAVYPWLHAVTLLHLPYTFENLLGKVENLLPAALGAPMPNWKTQPLPIHFFF
jgi:DNA-binding response OmpR family regulator